MAIIEENDTAYQEHQALTGRQVLDADPRCGGSPATYRARHIERRSAIASASRPHPVEVLGLAARIRIFAGEAAYQAAYALVPDDLGGAKADFTSSKVQSWMREQVELQRIVLKSTDDTWLASLSSSVRQDEGVAIIVREGRPGVTVRVTLDDDADGCCACQARFPWLHIDRERGRILAVDMAIVERVGAYPDIARRSRAVRLAAWERHLLSVETGIPVGAITIQRLAIEREVPHLVQIHDFDPAVMDRAHRLNLQVVDLLNRCRSTDTWPTYCGGVSRIADALMDPEELPNAEPSF